MSPAKPGTDWKTIIATGLMLGGFYAGLKVDINDVKGDVREAKAELNAGLRAVQVQASRVESNAITRDAAAILVRDEVEKETARRIDTLVRQRRTPVLSSPGSSVQ